MVIESEVLVVGGGLAGSMAALTAARSGADVRLVTEAESTLGMASGLIDVLGYIDDDGPVVDPFAAMADLHEGHPYRLLGPDVVRDALATFDEVIEGYEGGHTDANALVPTSGGTIKPTARYPETVAPGLASNGGDVLLIGFETLPDFDAPLAADHLTAVGVPFETAGTTVQFPESPPADAKVTRYANALEGNRSVSDDAPRAVDTPRAVEGDGRTENSGRVGVRTALAERVRSAIENAPIDVVQRVGVPAILGVEDPAGVADDLAEAIGTDVFEVPTGPPSLPGRRLGHELTRALDAAGVTVEAGNSVVDYRTDSSGRAVDRVVVDRNRSAVPFVANEFVLATGGLVGGGVATDRRTVREPVFDCHVPHPDDRYDWFADGVFEDHPFARFGVEVDSNLRPRDESGEVAFDNLRAAGSVLGGYDFAAEKSGSGVSIATGYAAGTAAAREVT